MSSYRRIAEQIITLLTILVSIMTILRQSGEDLPNIDLGIRQERIEQAAKRAHPLPGQVKTKIR